MNQNQSIKEYVIRLKTNAKYFQFGDDLNNQVRDQVSYQYRDIKLKRKLCNENNLALDKMLEISGAYNITKSHFSDNQSSVSNDNVGWVVKTSGATAGTSKSRCSLCGKYGHFQCDYPAKRLRVSSVTNLGMLHLSVKRNRILRVARHTHGLGRIRQIPSQRNSRYGIF